MREKKIRKDVRFLTILTKDDIAIYSEGIVIYPNEIIPFGKVIVDTKYAYLSGGYYVFDDKYIYAYLASKAIYSIFDIDNRCTIDDRYELLKIRDEVNEKKLSRKII